MESKRIDILNNPKYETQAKQFRENKIQQYDAREIAYINRYLEGEKVFSVGVDFSRFNLNLVLSLLTGE